MVLEKWNGFLLRMLGQVVGVIAGKEEDGRMRIIGEGGDSMVTTRHSLFVFQGTFSFAKVSGRGTPNAPARQRMTTTSSAVMIWSAAMMR